MNVGATIKNVRQQRGLSQGDLEKRTGLMRCYISRVENGHTVPSIETLSRIAQALELQLTDLLPDGSPPPNELSEQQFLEEIRRYLPMLSANEREQVVGLVRRIAETDN